MSEVANSGGNTVTEKPEECNLFFAFPRFFDKSSESDSN